MTRADDWRRTYTNMNFFSFANFSKFFYSLTDYGSSNNSVINENHDLYVVLPPGQNYTTSSTDPALGKQMAPAPMAPTAPTAHAKAYVNVIPAVPVSADPFRGKYTWDGREGYPGD